MTSKAHRASREFRRFVSELTGNSVGGNSGGSEGDHHPAGRGQRYDIAFLILCGLGCGVLAVGGDTGDAAQGVLSAAIMLPLYALTRRFTDAPSPSLRPPRLAAAALLIASLLALTTGELAAGPKGALLSAWSAVHWSIASALQRIVPVLDLETVNAAMTFAVLPAVILVLLGWRARDLGFGPSRRGTVRTFVLWCGILVSGYAVALFLGHGTLGALAHRTFIDVFRNGFAEEILFRGILLRMAAYAFGSSAGNVVQSLAFGFWHFGANMRDVHGNPTLAIFDGIATQALFGYVQGLLTLRTGNVLVAGSVHTLADAARALS